MAVSNLGRKSARFQDGLESIIIVNAVGDIPGGRTLDVSGVPADQSVIHAGHVIVQDNETGEFAPLAINGGAYAAIAEGKTAVGVLRASVLVSDPRAAIVTMGQINAAAAAKAVGAPITEAIDAALPHIQFLYV